MTYEPGTPVLRVRPTRSSVVAEALTEKLKSLAVARMEIEREQEYFNHKVAQLQSRREQVDAEIEELRRAIRDLGLDSPSTRLVLESEEDRWRQQRRRFSQANGVPPPVEVFSESRQQKQFLIREVRELLEMFGPMQLRQLHSMLETKGVEVPSTGRLSQILSESDIFEADRSRGWSLKE